MIRRASVLFLTNLSICVAFLALQQGCGGASGPAYQQHLSPPGKAIVYIYREGGYVGGAVLFQLFSNDQYVTRIDNGGYFDFVVDPGQIELKTVADAGPLFKSQLDNSYFAGQGAPTFSIDALPDQIYYLKLTITLGACQISRVDKDMAVKELTGMHRFDDPNSSNGG